MDGDIPDVCDGDPIFAQVLPLVVRLDLSAYFRPFGSLGTVEAVPKNIVEQHCGE